MPAAKGSTRTPLEPKSCGSHKTPEPYTILHWAPYVIHWMYRRVQHGAYVSGNMDFSYNTRKEKSTFKTTGACEHTAILPILKLKNTFKV